jgi:hypothetical protein
LSLGPITLLSVLTLYSLTLGLSILPLALRLPTRLRAVLVIHPLDMVLTALLRTPFSKPQSE